MTTVKVTTAAYKSPSNGSVERFHAYLAQSISNVVRHTHEDWDEHMGSPICVPRHTLGRHTIDSYRGPRRSMRNGGPRKNRQKHDLEDPNNKNIGPTNLSETKASSNTRLWTARNERCKVRSNRDSDRGQKDLELSYEKNAL